MRVIPDPRDSGTKRERTRNRLLIATQELLLERSAGALTIRDVSHQAELSHGTLYNYFEDRDAMVRALFETRRSTLRPELEAAMTSGADLAFEPRLRRFMRELFEAFESHHRYIQVVFQAEHLKPTGSHSDLIAALDEIVAAGVREGVVAKAMEETLGLVLAGSIRAVLMRRSQRGGSFALDAEPICSLVLDGARRP